VISAVETPEDGASNIGEVFCELPGGDCIALSTEVDVELLAENVTGITHRCTFTIVLHSRQRSRNPGCHGISSHARALT